jgi:membrane protease YdiL (CAAX protease family)
MRAKAVIGYVALLVLSLLLHAAKPANALYYSLLPALMLIFPIVAGHRVKLRFSIKDIIWGIVISLIILVPYYVIFGVSMKTITGYAFLFQLLSVSFPEEFFFRGFLQDTIGRNFTAVLLVSLLFAVAHVPKALFLGDWMSLLTFFPSLVMGWLYMKTNNVLPGTIFHLLANLIHQGTRYF